MANIKELLKDLKSLSGDQENTDKRIELVFQTMELYCDMQKKTNTDKANCIVAALKLSGIVKKGLGARAKLFLDKYNAKLPDRAVQLLSGNLMRMEGY